MNTKKFMWAALEREDVPKRHRFLLHVLSCMADEYGQCWPRTRQLAEWTGCSRGEISRSLRWLKEHGFIEVSRQGSGWGTNLYDLTFLRNQPSHTEASLRRVH